jgi:hypothetical protein
LCRKAHACQNIISGEHNSNNDTGDDSPLHSGNGYNGSDPLTDMTISSETGYIRVMFSTNYVLIIKM